MYSLPESEANFSGVHCEIPEGKKKPRFSLHGNNLDLYKFVSLHAQCSVCFDSNCVVIDRISVLQKNVGEFFLKLGASSSGTCFSDTQLFCSS